MAYMYEHDPLAEERLVFTIFEVKERLMRELEEMD